MTRVDWQKVHARLEEAKQAVERAGSPAAQDARRILRERARALAREPDAEAPVHDLLQVIEFVVAEERYAVEAHYVREVQPLRDLTPLPGTPPFVLGIVNVSGIVYSVIDIKKLFDLPDAGLTDLNKVIVLADAGMAFGILADRIVGTRSLPASDLQPSLPTLQGIRAQYLKGVTGDRMVVLAADKLLSDAGIVVREEPDT